jgi:hypothetical protein
MKSIQLTLNESVRVRNALSDKSVDFSSLEISITLSPRLDSYAEVDINPVKMDAVGCTDPAIAIHGESHKCDSSYSITVSCSGHNTSNGKKHCSERTSTASSRRTFLCAIARRFFFEYDFDRENEKASMSDLLAAREGGEGETWKHVRDLAPKDSPDIPLPLLFTPEEWNILSSMNAEAPVLSDDLPFPLTRCQKLYITVPHCHYIKKGYVDSLKSIALKSHIVPVEVDFAVFDELEVSKIDG